MTDQLTHVVVLVACDAHDEARTLARTLVEERLAACAQVLPIESFYLWDGKLHDNHEHLILLKTTTAHYHALERRVLELHSYRVPEVIALPVTVGFGGYLEWVEEAVGDVEET